MGQISPFRPCHHTEKNIVSNMITSHPPQVVLYYIRQNVNEPFLIACYEESCITSVCHPERVSAAGLLIDFLIES